jgi:hypothetical protein
VDGWIFAVVEATDRQIEKIRCEREPEEESGQEAPPV